jgi:hypothetical protein
MVTARDGARADQALAEVVAGKTATVTLTSKGTATIAGQAIDLVTRKPLAGLECNESGAWTERPSAVTDTQGRFKLDVAAGRPVTVRCGSVTRGLRTVGRATVELAPDTSRDVVVEVAERRR